MQALTHQKSCIFIKKANGFGKNASLFETNTKKALLKSMNSKLLAIEDNAKSFQKY